MQVHEVQYVSLSDILDEDEHEMVSDVITNDFTWGDTAVVLVTQKDLRHVFDKRACSADRYAFKAVQKVRDALYWLDDDIFVNLY